MGIKSFFNRMLGKENAASKTSTATEDSSPAENPEPEVDLSKAFARIYSVQLYFESKPTDLQGDAVLEGMKSLLSNVERTSGDAPERKNSLHFLFHDHTVNFADAQGVPAQILVFNAEKSLQEPVVNDPNYAPAFGQCWDFPDAKEKLSRCRHTVMVTDMMSSGLGYESRMQVFQRALYAIVQVLQPVAIYWLHSQRWMDAQDYLQNVPDTEGYDILHGPMHVRLFRIEGTNQDETVMDTLGLAAIGLPDIQIHSHSLDPNALAGTIHGAGRYIFERGDIIEDGNTIAGPHPDDRWVCRHEVAIAGPERMVLDINPGAQYAAGNRS